MKNPVPEITPFQERVYKLCSKIPKGKVSTYNTIAKALYSSPRAVGQALKRNPYAPMVPCHRIVKSDGSLGGYNGIVNNSKKVTMLKKEGVAITENRVDEKCILRKIMKDI